MLVLTVRVNGKIYLPSLGICITVVDPQRGKARVGVEAPQSVKVLRGELMTEELMKEFESNLKPEIKEAN